LYIGSTSLIALSGSHFNISEASTKNCGGGWKNRIIDDLDYIETVPRASKLVGAG